MGSKVTPQDYINIIFGTVATVIGWLGRELWQAIKELRSDLARLREELPSRYVPKDEFHNFSAAILKKLDRIEDKIDKKLDKDSYHG